MVRYFKQDQHCNGCSTANFKYRQLVALSNSIELSFQILLSSPKYIEKSSEYDFVRPWLGEGLLISSGRKWQTHRKIITPTFHFKILEEFMDIFDQQGNTFVDILHLFAKSGETFDVFPLVTLCALDVICGKLAAKGEWFIVEADHSYSPYHKCIAESAMGTKVNAQMNSESEYVKAVKELSTICKGRRETTRERC